MWSSLGKQQGAVKDVETERPVGDLPRFDDMVAWLRRNMVKDEVTLMHGDYKPDNLVFHPEMSQVIAILDWEMSTIGHPLSDLANFTM